MLSYRHSFHAGNHADVLKHLIQLAVVRYLGLKDKPFVVIDTHAGAGAYSLKGDMANKTQEYREGILRLWQEPQAIDHPLIQDYLNAVAQLNPNGKLENYPGSPSISLYGMRRDDRLFAHELHPSDYAQLNELLGHRRQVKVYREDGFKHGLALLPPVQKRGLVLIDPPYELKEDYQRVVSLLVDAHKRFSTGTYALWYPVVERARIDELKAAMQKSGIKKIDNYELAMKSDSNEWGMTASGMMLINAPWTLRQDMQSILPKLSELLAGTQGSYRIEEWVGE